MTQQFPCHQLDQRFPKLRIRENRLLLFLILIATVPLIIGTFPFALYVSLAGGSLRIPMGIWGLGIKRVHRSRPGQGTTFVLKHRWFFGPSIGPIMQDRGYESTISIDYPLLPVMVDTYKRRP